MGINIYNDLSMEIGNTKCENAGNVYSENSDLTIGHVNKSGNTKQMTYASKDRGTFVSIGENGKNVIRNKPDCTKQSMTSVKDSELMRDYMTIMSNSLSDEDFAKLRDEGFEPGKMEPGQMVTIVDEIKATVAKSGKVINGYNDNLDEEVLKEITGSTAQANAIIHSFKENDVPITKENIEGAMDALDEAGMLTPLSDAEQFYMVDNGMEPTINNVYLAKHSGSNMVQRPQGMYMEPNGYITGMTLDENDADEEIDGTELSKFKEIVEQAGYEADEYDMGYVSRMLRMGLEISPSSYDSFRNIVDMELPLSVDAIADRISKSIKGGRRPVDAVLSSDKSLYDKAVRLTEIIRKSLDREECRLSMTVSATYMLLKNNIDIDFSNLNLLVDNLKEAENRQFEAVFGRGKQIDETAAEDIFSETVTKVNELRNMPVAAVGIVSFRDTLTINTLYEAAAEKKADYEKAGVSYETMMTEIRSDLGDKITKAFANTEDILNEIGMKTNELNKKAVRVLGYNSMEITSQSVEKVCDALIKTESVITRMNPGKVVNLIRNGVNPLELSFDKLIERLDKMDDSLNTADKYAKFLCKLDERHELTEAERESYIGIYRMINNIEKNDMAAVGTLINAEMEINFSNLLTAVRIRKNSGIDIKLGDKNGELDQIIAKGINISDQIGKPFVALNDMTFGREDGNPDESKGELLRKQFEEIENELVRKAGRVDEQVVNALEQMEIPTSVENIVALNDWNTPGAFDRIKKKMRDDESFDKLIENSILNFTDEKTADDAYEDMTTRLKQMIGDTALFEKSISDIRSMSLGISQMYIASEMAGRRYYKVPMQIGSEIVDMNVHIKSGENKGVEISFECEKYGSVNGRFSYSGSKLNGVFSVNQNEGYERLTSLTDRFRDAFRETCPEVEDIKFIKSERVNINFLSNYADEYINNENASNGMGDEESKDAVSVKTLYTVAGVFMRVIA